MKTLDFFGRTTAQLRTLTLGLVTTLALGSAITPEARAEQAAAETDTLREMKEEVAALALYQALDLSPAQRKEMLGILDDFHGSMAAVERARVAREANVAKELENAKRQLNTTGTINPQTQTRLFELNEKQHQADKAARETVKPVREALTQQLSADQQLVLANFKTNEALYGKAAVEAQADARLEELRNMAPERLDLQVTRIVRKAQSGGMSQAQAIAEGEKFRSFVNDIQAVPEDLWEESRAGFAKRMDKEPLFQAEPAGRPNGRRNARMSADRLLMTDSFYEALKAGR